MLNCSENIINLLRIYM